MPGSHADAPRATGARPTSSTATGCTTSPRRRRCSTASVRTQVKSILARLEGPPAGRRRTRASGRLARRSATARQRATGRPDVGPSVGRQVEQVHDGGGGRLALAQSRRRTAGLLLAHLRLHGRRHTTEVTRGDPVPAPASSARRVGGRCRPTRWRRQHHSTSRPASEELAKARLTQRLGVPAAGEWARRDDQVDVQAGRSGPRAEISHRAELDGAAHGPRRRVGRGRLTTPGRGGDPAQSSRSHVAAQRPR